MANSLSYCHHNASVFRHLEMTIPYRVHDSEYKRSNKNKDIQLEHDVLHLHTGIRLQIQCSTV